MYQSAPIGRKGRKGVIVNDFELENWLPMGPMLGPPLPRFLNIFWPWYKPPLPEPPEKGVVVGLLNPPNEAENWSLTLTDWDITVPIKFVGRNGKKRLDITEAATFEIPNGLNFPLRVVALQVTKWNEARTALIQLYYVQSFRPIKPFTIAEADPDYKEVFIPEYGSYYYNVAAEQFEKV